MRGSLEKLNSSIEEAQNKLETLARFYNFAPIYNSIEIIQRIKINIEDKVFLSENIDYLNLGLLASKALDNHPEFQNYAESLYDLMDSLLVYLGQPFTIPAPSSPQGIAYNFYKAHGFSPKKIRSHIQGIDFRFKVSIKPLQIGKTVSQWKLKSKPQGNYYSEPGKNPDCLGINSNQEDLSGKIGVRLEHMYSILNDLKVLMSTAAPVLDIWSIKSRPIQTRGGCIQYFNQNEIKDFKLIP